MPNSIDRIHTNTIRVTSSEPTELQIMKELRNWVAAPRQGEKEYRSIAYDKIIECFHNSSKKRLILRGLGLTVAPPHFPPNVEVVDLSGNHLREFLTPCSKYVKDVILNGNPIGMSVVTPNPTSAAKLCPTKQVAVIAKKTAVMAQPKPAVATEEKPVLKRSGKFVAKKAPKPAEQPMQKAAKREAATERKTVLERSASFVVTEPRKDVTRPKLERTATFLIGEPRKELQRPNVAAVDVPPLKKTEPAKRYPKILTGAPAKQPARTVFSGFDLPSRTKEQSAQRFAARFGVSAPAADTPRTAAQRPKRS